MTASRAAAALATGVFLLSGCDGKSAAEKRQCYDSELDRAFTQITIRAYRRGELGTRSDIEAELAKENRPSFFDGNGNILPIEDMDTQQRVSWGRFVEQSAQETRDERHAAVLAARMKCDYEVD